MDTNNKNFVRHVYKVVGAREESRTYTMVRKYGNSNLNIPLNIKLEVEFDHSDVGSSLSYLLGHSDGLEDDFPFCFLVKAETEEVYYSMLGVSRLKVIFIQFSNSGDEMIVDQLEGEHPNTVEQLNRLIENHEFLY